MPKSCCPLRGIEKSVPKKIIIALYFSSSVKDQSLTSEDFLLTIQNWFIYHSVSKSLFNKILCGLLCPKPVSTSGCIFNCFTLFNNMITSKMNVVQLKFSEIECIFSSVQNAYHKNTPQKCSRLIHF